MTVTCDALNFALLLCARVKYSVLITGSVVAIIGTSSGEAADTPNTAQRGPASAGPAAGPLVYYTAAGSEALWTVWRNNRSFVYRM